MIYYLGLGTNIGDLEQNLKNALMYISEIKGCKIKKISAFYNTKPWGFEYQDDFLNLVTEIEAVYPPQEFIYHLQHIEKNMGRIDLCKWGPRIIDIDILFCDDMVIDTEELKIPHPFLHQREFVLRPMLEIAPDFIYPTLKVSIKDLYDELLQEEKC